MKERSHPGKVQNWSKLVANGKTPRLQEMRAIALDLFELALEAADPAACVRRHLRGQMGALEIGGRSFPLSSLERVVLVGGGKAAAAMAAEVCRLLRAFQFAGAIEGAIAIPNSLLSVPDLPKRIRVYRSSHPISDAISQEAAQAVLETVGTTGPRDLVVAVVSGGASALLETPAPPVTLDDIKQMNKALLKSGANITEINTVRKHVSAIKGGNLARRSAGAPLISLVISDVVGDLLEVIASGPTVPDKTSFKDVANIIDKYHLASQLPKSIRERIDAGLSGAVPDTPKDGDPAFNQATTILAGSVADAVKVIADHAHQAGWQCRQLSAEFTGEASERGRTFVPGLPLTQLKPGCNIFLQTGELTVTIKGKGTGGRNQEMLLAAATSVPKNPPIVILSAGMDGIEGNSPAAGAIIDNHTTNRARALQLDPRAALLDNNSFHYFDALGDAVITGLTGTNVNDLTISVCWKE